MESGSGRTTPSCEMRSTSPCNGWLSPESTSSSTTAGSGPTRTRPFRGRAASRYGRMVESDSAGVPPEGRLAAVSALNSEITVMVADVSVAVGEAQLLENVTFDCRAGEWTLVYGPTGSGKSTLLRAINGLRPLTHGSISTLGTRIPGRSGREARTVWRKTGTVLQEVALFETKTALANVALVLR